MKSEDLFSALGKIDGRYIDCSVPKKMPVYKRNTFRWVTAAAACLCLFISGYLMSGHMKTGKLPVLDNYSIVFEPMGMGYEGTDDLEMNNSDDINPWNENTVLDTLPVFKNLRYSGGSLWQSYYSADELKNQTVAFADLMGLDIIGGEAVYAETENEVYNYVLNTQQGTVSSGGTGISLNLKKGYESLLNKHISYCFGSETESVSGICREYSVDGELLSTEKRSYYKYGDIADNIVSFNLRSHWQSSWSDGNTDYINSRNDDYLSCSEKLGDYPVIGIDEARAKLIAGEYATSADEESVEGGKITEEVIAKTDLIYYTAGNQQLYMPYYRFYVKYYSGDGEIQRYAYFYVCAIEEEYLGGYEKFDGSFQ